MTNNTQESPDSSPKFALGMGDVKHLSDGLFNTIEEAHKAAKHHQATALSLKTPYTCYTIGNITASSEVALQYVNEISKSIIEVIREELAEQEDFGSEEGDWITIKAAASEKIKQLVTDILSNDTTYPNARVVSKVVNYSCFMNTDTENTYYEVACAYCQASNHIETNEKQRNGSSIFGFIECVNCKTPHNTAYNKDDDTLKAIRVRLC